MLGSSLQFGVWGAAVLGETKEQIVAVFVKMDDLQLMNADITWVFFDDGLFWGDSMS